MTLDVLICTLDDGICRVPQALAAPQAGVRYVVSMQFTDEGFLSAIPDSLAGRPDVHLTTLAGRGLSRNRNHAFRQAEADIVLIADDDERFTPEGLRAVVEAFEADDSLDIGLFRLTDYDGNLFKHYPDRPASYAEAVREGYYVASFEMALRRSVLQRGLSFDERFGLGSPCLACGEEAVLLKDAADMMLKICCLPVVVGSTEPVTTGSRFPSDPAVQRSKGACFAHCYGPAEATWRCMKEALHYFIFKGVNPLPLFRNMRQGIHYLLHSERPAPEQQP